MQNIELKRGGLREMARRREIGGSPSDLVALGPLPGGGPLPLLIQAAADGIDLAAWASGRRGELETRLREHGGLLFRGFGLRTPAELERLVRALCGELLEYTYRSTPRTQVQGEIYTSTEYPADQTIPMHNEMSYARSWPRQIFFACAAAAPAGGETPVADSRRVFSRIPPEVRERFMRLGVCYVRNYGEGIDLPWQDVFQTSDRDSVEAFCRQAGLELEWRGADGLRTRQVCQATAVHPVTGEDLWFNQAHLFHVSSLPPALRESLLATLTEEELPRNAFYGDGSPIEPEALAVIRAAYDEESVIFPWADGDVLWLDNMLTAHGRRPYAGPRKILVGMAEPWSAGGN
jgi:alpha-ketoglutarate-dependent taurine dioxygenase